MTRLPNAAPKPPKRKQKPRKPIRRSRVRQKAGKPRRFRARRDPEYLAWIRELGCCVQVAHHSGMTEAAHVTSRGAGGEDRGNTLPLCHLHHHQQHWWGIATWQAAYFPNDNLDHLAALYLAQYERETERYDRERSVG